MKRASVKMQRVFEEMADVYSEQEEADFHLEEGEDVMGRYGSGIVSYFALIWRSALFLVMAVLVFVPLMMQYSSWVH